VLRCTDLTDIHGSWTYGHMNWGDFFVTALHAVS
jgi:hypothetical protein